MNVCGRDQEQQHFPLSENCHESKRFERQQESSRFSVLSSKRKKYHFNCLSLPEILELKINLISLCDQSRAGPTL